MLCIWDTCSSSAIQPFSFKLLVWLLGSEKSAAVLHRAPHTMAHVKTRNAPGTMRLLSWDLGVQVTDSGTLLWYCETSGEEVWSSKHQ